MPRISKIRLTGCKYDRFNKEHENSIFDLTKEGNPDHSLFTLGNGCGKGVMLQLIFQILMPGTKWGRNNGNKVISMFYDQRNNLNPYTFHVVLEWVLDTIPEKRLITGIAVKPIMKHISLEEEERAGLSYFLYTYEHDNNGYYNVDNLPIYDKSTGESVDITKFEEFINENKRDFIKYSMSSARRGDGEYYKYLEARGIHRPEWNILKTINKSEGGVGDYFIGASDNKSVFDRIIIPAISENIRNYSYDDENNLINMFKSNLSITKDLPILIKREAYYKDLLVEIKPLIENADSGSRFIDLKNRLVDQGNDIYFILKDEDRIAGEELEKWQNSMDQAKNEQKELNFNKDNLYYNKEKRELESNLNKSEELNKIVHEKIKGIEENEKELVLYRVNKVLSSKNSLEIEINNKVEERRRLIEALDIQDIKTKAEELEDEIHIEWKKTKSSWENSENQYIGYMNYSRGIIEENTRKKKAYEIRKDSLQNQINRFNLKKEGLLKEKDELRKYYDDMSLEFPERIQEDLIKSKEEIEKSINSILNEIKETENRVGDINSNITRLEYDLKNKEVQVNSLKLDIVEREKYELELARKVSSQLLESYSGEFLNHNWFSNKLESLRYLRIDKEEKLENIQRVIWEKNIDKSLNRENYFIPNKDILLIKDEIEGRGIHVETGTEYLKDLDSIDKNEIIKNYPGFIYSLVVGSLRDWELVEKNIGKDMFLNNMVPIYIRSEMKSSDQETFRTIVGKAYELVEGEDYNIWKENLDKEFQNLSNTEDNLKTDVEDINEIIQELRIIEDRDTVYILDKKLRALEKGILEIEEDLRLNREEKLNLDNKLKSLESKLDEGRKSLVHILELIKLLEEYMETLKDIEREEKIIFQVKEDLSKINKDILNIDDDNEGWRYKQGEISILYNEWKVRTEDIVKDLQKIFNDINLNYKTNQDYVDFNIPDFSINYSKLISLVNERKIIEEDINSKNSSIAVLDEGIKQLTKRLEDYIDDLEKLDKNWKNYDDLMIPENEINMIIDEIEKRTKALEKERSNAKSEYDRIQGTINTMTMTLEDREKQIFKIHNRRVTILEDEDIHSAINIVENNIISNGNYLVLCEEELLKNDKSKNKLQLNLSRMETGYELDLTRGKMDKLIKDRIRDNPDIVVENWLSRCRTSKFEIKKTIDEGQNYRRRFIENIESKLEKDRLKDKIITVVKEANIENFKNNISSFKSMENHFQQELLRLSKDKERAESSMKQWVNRASIYVIRMVEALKDMVASMNYVNEQEYIFPLVKLKGIERLPREEAEISYLLEEYFIQAIGDILKENEDIDNIDDKEFKKFIGDSIIFSKALKGSYPTLMVYKMSQKNEFKFAKARDEYYTTWEAINKGEGDLPEGSGGQTLSVNTFVIMMIMSFKKRNIGNENPSTVLILDNPFGTASDRHVLDPIFEIADKLNFQLICLAPPNIIKVEISERFPVFWELKVEDGKIVHGGRIVNY